MARTVIVSGADVSLFHVAAREMGDPLQWWRIAQANGLSDPSLAGAGVLTLTIPASAPAAADGLPTR